MTQDSTTETVPTKNRGWQVALAGMGINLALGVLYAWSVVSKGIPAEWGWSESDRSMPYAIACLVFCLVMVPAGRMQAKMGPRVVASIGGLLVGLGFVVCSTTTSLIGYVLGFGILAGSGFGFGYASATPPAVKWFPPAMTGRIAGIVVSGFGLASVYVAPLTKWLMANYGLQKTVLILGIAFLIVVVGLAQLLVAPHKAFQFIKGTGPIGEAKKNLSAPVAAKPDFAPRDILKTGVFYVLWFMYACSAGAGLMIISKLAKMADAHSGIKQGAMLVALLAVGNGAGRILAGMLSDRIGRKATFAICAVLQACVIATFATAKAGTPLATLGVLIAIALLVGANYGANLALFPAITKDFFGLKNFGVNYGLVFTAWGMGGFMLSQLTGKLYDVYKTFNVAFYGAVGLLILAAIATVFVKPPAAPAALAVAKPE